MYLPLLTLHRNDSLTSGESKAKKLIVNSSYVKFENKTKSSFLYFYVIKIP